VAAHSAAEVGRLPCDTVVEIATPDDITVVFSVHAVASNASVTVPELSDTVPVVSPAQTQLELLLPSKMQHWTFEEAVEPGGEHSAAAVTGLPVAVIVSVVPLSGDDRVSVRVHVDALYMTVVSGSSSAGAVESLPHMQVLTPASSPKAQQPAPEDAEPDEEHATNPRIDAKSAAAGIRILIREYTAGRPREPSPSPDPVAYPDRRGAPVRPALPRR
jgi:hypothetical protein